MAKKYKPFFVSEELHQRMKSLAVKEKISLIALIERLLNLGKKVYESSKQEVGS